MKSLGNRLTAEFGKHAAEIGCIKARVDQLEAGGGGGASRTGGGPGCPNKVILESKDFDCTVLGQ